MRYSATLLEHFYNPQNVGVFDDVEKCVGTGVVGTRANGVVIHFQLKIQEQRIVATRFKAYGNAATIATCSFAAQWLQNKTVDEGRTLTSMVLVKTLAIPELKMHCALLVEDVINKAIHDYQVKCSVIPL